MLDRPDLNDLEILCAVVDRGSFRAAADYVGTSQPTVSRAITRLEERIGRPLVLRNSRSVAPTELGLHYAQHARRLLRGFDEVEAELFSGDGLAGRMSISAPPAFGRRALVPILSDFCTEHPELLLDISLENRRVDLLEDRVDIAIRFGPLTPSWRRQRLLLRGRYRVYGPPGCRDGTDGLELERLVQRHRCLVFHSTHLRNRWPVATAEGVHWLTVSPALTCDDVEALIRLAVAGVGITLMPDFLVQEEVERGQLAPLTGPEAAVPAEVFAMTADEERPERVDALLEHLADTFRELSG
jgi:DNA-binding transcriptional LysR family regulator